MENIIGIVFLATFIEGLVEYLFKGVNGESLPYLKYIALAMGVVLAIAYKIDILGMLGLVTPLPLVGNVVSGIILGRGSNYVNDAISLLRK